VTPPTSATINPTFVSSPPAALRQHEINARLGHVLEWQPRADTGVGATIAPATSSRGELGGFGDAREAESAAGNRHKDVSR